MKRYIDMIRSRTPLPREKVNLEPLYETPLAPFLEAMEKTPQSPVYHAEGNVLNHTKRVLRELVTCDEYAKETEEGRFILFLAALLHDIGKIECTKVEGAEIISPRHSIVGSKMARRLLWQKLSLSGDAESIRLREAICMLIRYHSYPPFCIEDKDDLRLHRIAANGELCDAFSLRRLITLEYSDVFGRIGSGVYGMGEKMTYCEMMAEELGILDTPYPFVSEYSRRAYFKRRLNFRGGDLFKPDSFEVVLMSGLPGTGKDTYISKNLRGMQVVSLDDIRDELGVSPTDNQSKVVAAAHERAKVLLRKKEPFVWNATSITAELRAIQISLFEEYGASVRCVYLETECNENLRRNAERERQVPERVIEKLLSRLELPEIYECEKVEWHAV